MGERRGDDGHVRLSSGGITRIFTSDECQFRVHPCNIELDKVYSFRSPVSAGDQQPGFKLEAPGGVRTLHLHYQYVMRGALSHARVPSASDPPPENDICNPDIYWKMFFPNGGQNPDGAGEIASCNFTYTIFVCQSLYTEPPPTGYMISIGHFHPPKGSDALQVNILAKL